VKKEVYRELYERIRGGAERLWVVDNVYGAMEGKRVRGARVGLRKWRRKVTGRREELWRMWDGMAGVENGEEGLAEVGFKRVVFMLKNGSESIGSRKVIQALRRNCSF
jgi:hypothetical protein